MDPEHSYLFCRTVTIGGGCWQLTLVTTRTLNLLYFDGSSAAKLEDGSLDSQEVLAWGSLGPDRNHRETERVKLLCDWGTPIGYDGFVRSVFFTIHELSLTAFLIERMEMDLYVSSLIFRGSP